MKNELSLVLVVALLTQTHCQAADAEMVFSSTEKPSTWDTHATSEVTSTSFSSVSITSSVDSTSSPLSSTLATTSLPTERTFRVLVRYGINSSSSLQLGNINDSNVLNSVRIMVVSSFNLSDFEIKVTHLEISTRTRSASFENHMLTANEFKTSRANCDESCIKASALRSIIPKQSFTLPDSSGSLVTVTASSGPRFTDDTSTTTVATINHRRGERPPGLGARLGMGLSIPIISVLLLVEIVYFYRKYYGNGSSRELTYEIASYINPPAV